MQATKLLSELKTITDLGEPHDGSRTFILCRGSVYLSGSTRLYSAFSDRAFIFKDAAQAKRLIKQFPVLLAGASVGHFNRTNTSRAEGASTQSPVGAE